MNTNALPPLSPPYGELPPTVWEQHGTALILIGLGIIALAALGSWLVLRARPKIIIPPEDQARFELAVLRRQPEDGAVLSRVSQIIRAYFIAAFELPAGELTTTEFIRELSRSEKINLELSNAAAGFLRECDARKFSPSADSTKLDVAHRALNLVEQAEQRRAQLRQLAEAQIRDPRA